MPAADTPSRSPLPEAVADLVRRMASGTADGAAADLVARACAEAVRAIGRGDVCLPLDRLAGRTPADIRLESDSRDGGDADEADGAGEAEEEAAEEAAFRFPDVSAVAAALRAFPAVVADAGAVPPGGDLPCTPFVLDRGRLYTRRNHSCECRIRTRLDALAATGPAAVFSLPVGDSLMEGLTAEQRAALETILSRRFAILTGGPGTGKTHVLARAVQLALRAEPALRVRLAAPTGKAAARMAESFAASGGILPEPPCTLHSLIGKNPATGTFRHNPDRPLAVDWLVVDEASMVDLLLFGHVLDALPRGARLLLIGDPRQLASVERGHILRDLCEAAGAGGAPRYPIARLSSSHRFPPEGAIACFAAAVNAGDESAAFGVFSGDAAREGLAWVAHSPDADKGPDAWPGFRSAVLAGFAALARATDPAEALHRVNDCRVLCAVRKGPFGMERVNACIRTWMPPSAPMPVMVAHNDDSLGVRNGDLGLVFPSAPDTAWLEPAAPGGAPRRIPRMLLPGLETAWATTVHKSQGSEYTDVAIVLPGDSASPLLTREILYTAVTRTRRSVRLWASASSLRSCIGRTVSRASGFSV